MRRVLWLCLALTLTAAAGPGWVMPEWHRLDLSTPLAPARRDARLEGASRFACAQGELIQGAFDSASGTSVLELGGVWRVEAVVDRTDGAVRTIQRPNLRVVGVADDRVVVRCPVGRYEGGIKTATGLVSFALSLKDGSLLWTSDPVAVPLVRQPRCGLVSQGDVFEFYEAPREGPEFAMVKPGLLILRRHLSDGKVVWSRRLHDPSRVPADGLKAARADGRELVIRYGYLLMENHQQDRVYRFDRRDGKLLH
ncbi:MAG: hypothetical protein AB7S38_32025 [Vulcanimicrobiota bacterium]